MWVSGRRNSGWVCVRVLKRQNISLRYPQYNYATGQSFICFSGASYHGDDVSKRVHRRRNRTSPASLGPRRSALRTVPSTRARRRPRSGPSCSSSTRFGPRPGTSARHGSSVCGPPARPALPRRCGTGSPGRCPGSSCRPRARRRPGGRGPGPYPIPSALVRPRAGRAGSRPGSPRSVRSAGPSPGAGGDGARACRCSGRVG